MTTGVDDTLAAHWAWWHAERENKLRQPYGWLSLTGLHWLSERQCALPGVPGQWQVDADRVRVCAEASAGLIVDGQPMDGTAEVAVADDGSVTFAEFDGIAIEVIERSGRYGIRVRDPRAPLLSSFHGVPTFPVSPRWVIAARLDRYPSPREVVVATAQDGLSGTELAVGVLRFTICEQPQSLVAFADGDDGATVVFGDATNGVSTAPWRALWAQLSAEDDTVPLDFNRAVNLPSAFSAYGTCPRPPAGNMLSIAVEAGERSPITE